MLERWSVFTRSVLLGCAATKLSLSTDVHHSIAATTSWHGGSVQNVALVPWTMLESVKIWVFLRYLVAAIQELIVHLSSCLLWGGVSSAPPNLWWSTSRPMKARFVQRWE